MARSNEKLKNEVEPAEKCIGRHDGVVRGYQTSQNIKRGTAERKGNSDSGCARNRVTVER